MSGGQSATGNGLVVACGALYLVVLWGSRDQFVRRMWRDRKSTRLNSSHANISDAVFCLKKDNSSTIGAEVHLAFGVTKATGNVHREAGTQVLDIFTEWKSVYVDYSVKLQRAQIDEVNFE